MTIIVLYLLGTAWLDPLSISMVTPKRETKTRRGQGTRSMTCKSRRDNTVVVQLSLAPALENVLPKKTQ